MMRQGVLAFSLGALAAQRAVFGGTSSPVCPIRTLQVQSARVVAAPRMAYGLDENEVTAGFTTYAERLNGRAAMIGFVCALGFELLFPESHGLVPQVQALLDQFL
jgi:hypothetical protein